MSEHIYEDVKVPARYRPLLRRLQRGQWRRADLEWILRTHRDLPPLVASVIREKLEQAEPFLMKLLHIVATSRHERQEDDAP
jgi:hypothetical protein